MSKLNRPLIEYRKIRELNFKGTERFDRELLLGDLLRDLVLVEHTQGEGIKVAFKREFQAWFKALEQGSRQHHWATVYENLVREFNQGGQDE